MKKRLCSVFIAILALTLTACHRNEAIPVCPSLPDGFTSGTASEVAAWDHLPQMYIHYEDADFNSSAELTRSEARTWGAMMADGSHGIIECDGARPYQMENLCTVTMADTVGEVRLAYFPEILNAVEGAEFYAAEALTGLTLTAYPAAEDGTVDLTPEKAQTIPVANGRFTLLVGRYYYELTLSQDGGQLVYGFLAHRIDAEEYKVTEHQDGCFVTHEYEDPDHRTKTLAKLSLGRPNGHDGGSGVTLGARGRIIKKYTNYAGTAITMIRDNGDPLAAENIYTLDAADLAAAHTAEFDTLYPASLAFYNRYDLSGTHLEGDVVFRANGEITFKENSYYIFTVNYEDGSAQYVLKTGEAYIPPHPMDDPSIPTEEAALMRTEFHRGYYGADKAGDGIYIARYLGKFGGMDAVIMSIPSSWLESKSPVTVAGYTLEHPDLPRLYLHYRARYYTLEQAYQFSLITQSDICEIEKLLQATPTS